MFNNPNFYSYPNFSPKPSLFSSLKKLNFSEILNGTQKTLNVINQAIPIFHQIKPLWNNARTIFKIANAINEKPKDGIKTNKSQEKNINSEPNTNQRTIHYNEPTFFI